MMLYRTEEFTDAELIKEIKEGDDTALDILVRRHISAIYTFCLRFTGSAEDAQDATQETFLKAWKNIGRFDTRKSFRTWLYAIARNTATDLLRKRKHIPFSLFDTDDSETSVADSLIDEELLPDQVFERTSDAEEIRDAVEELKPRDQLIISMRYEEELPFEDIAKILRIPAATVRSLHRRALSALRNTLEQRR